MTSTGGFGRNSLSQGIQSAAVKKNPMNATFQKSYFNAGRSTGQVKPQSRMNITGFTLDSANNVAFSTGFDPNTIQITKQAKNRDRIFNIEPTNLNTISA